MAKKKTYQKGLVLENNQLCSNVYEIKIEGDFSGEPGQFYMFRSWDDYPLLSRPFSICDLGDGWISFLYLIVGKGTDLMTRLVPGDPVKVLGPLGQGFEINPADKKVAVVAGGIGNAPMLYLIKNLPVKADLYLGYRDEVYFVDQLSAYANKVEIATDSGSQGVKGNVLDIFSGEYDRIYSCGPDPMLVALKDAVGGDRLQLSMERRMGCGVGICYGCSVETVDGILRACVDGPVFKGSDLI